MKEYRLDEYFDGFMEDFGEPFESTPITEEVINTYRDKLPERLFTYWRGVGTCGFGDGLFWMTDPTQYQEILDNWLEGTVFEERKDLSVIARNAFGVLYVWAKNKGIVLKIYPMTNAINYFKENDKRSFSSEKNNEDWHMESFWGFTDLDEGDYEDTNDKPLFERALKKFGRLHTDEMYGFSHSPVMGGKEILENLDVVKLEIYHDIAKQLGGVQIVEIVA